MTKAEAKSEYLYKHFRINRYKLRAFHGPKAGEPAKDFAVVDFEGNKQMLSNFRGRWVVIEVGSATCTQYTKNIGAMEQLKQDFPDVEFLLIYVREAHPGERLPQHRSFEDKLKAARLLPKRYNENRKILIDALDGDMHQAYGSMPNFVYIVRPDGIVHYRCNWATLEGVRQALEDREHLHTNENADMKQLLDESLVSWNRIRTMWTGGFIAFWDFLIALPSILAQHRKTDKYYKEHGEFPEERQG